MAIAYSAGGMSQTNDTVTGNTLSAAVAVGATTLTFANLGFTNAAATPVVVGKIITAPAALAGALVTGVAPAGTTNITVMTISIAATAAITSGTIIGFADTDHIITGGTGVTLTDNGTFPSSRTRLINLTGSGIASGGTTGRLIVNGTFYNDAKWNTYTIPSSGGQSTNSGIVVSSTGTFNSVNTTNGLTSGSPIGNGSVTFRPSNQAVQQDSYGAPIFVAGTLSMNGTGYYGNNYWTLDGSGTVGCVVNLINATVRTGLSTGGALISVYSDGYNGAATTNGRHTFNINNSSIVDTYLKFLAVKPTSQFTSVSWYKTIPQTYTLSTNLDCAIAIAPSATTDTYGFNFSGPSFGIAGNPASYYNTHIGIGNTVSNSDVTARPAIRSTIYGYQIGVAPAIGKVPDFPSMRPWIEGRKNFALTLLKPNGSLVTTGDVSTYLEDSNLNTGQLATVAIFAVNGGNTGWNNGTYTSNASAITGGGTGGSISITVTGGRITHASILAAGSGYTATSGTGIQIAVNSDNFTGIGTGTAVTIIAFPYRRYGAYAAGNGPDFTAQRTYSATTNSSGLLVSSSNPVKGDGTAAYTGIDFLVWVANAAYPDSASTWSSSQFLAPIDQRWSANGSTAYSINVPLRGYSYQDTSYALTEAVGGGATPQLTDTQYLINDDFVQATGITSTTASGYTDVTLVAAAPTRNANTNVITPTATGTLTVGTTARSLDQVYAKAKYDYVQPVLNVTAGTVARTGFGMASFLTPSGVLNKANLNIGSWNLISGAALTSSVFTTLTTTGTATLNYINSTYGSYVGITATSITFAAGSTVLGSVTAADTPAVVTLTLPTTGTIINTDGDINGNTPSVSAAIATGNITVRGNFNYGNVFLDTFAYTMGTNTITFTGNHDFFDDVQLSDARGQVTVGGSTTRGNYQNLFLKDGAGPISVLSGTFNRLLIGQTTPSTSVVIGAVDASGTRVSTSGASVSNSSVSTTISGATMTSTLSSTSPTINITSSSIAGLTAGSCNTVVFTNATLSGSSSVTNSTKSTSYLFASSGLTVSANSTLSIASTPATATTIAPILSLRTAGVLSIDCGNSNSLTIDAAGVTFADTSSTFVRPAGYNTGVTIKLLNWPSGKAIPPGFEANITTIVNISFTDSPTTAPVIRSASLFKNGSQTNLLTGLTPTFTSGVGYSYSLVNSASDVINGGLFVIRGYQYARGTTTNAAIVNVTMVPEVNVDTGQTLITADSDFIRSCSYNGSNALVGTSQYVKITTSSGVDYTSSPSSRTAVEKAKYVLWEIINNNDTNTTTFRYQLATGTTPVNFMSFTQTGVVVNGITGVAAGGVGLQFNKTASSSFVITFAIWAVDNLGNFYSMNNAAGRSTTSATTLILFEGFSPGAVANFTTGQLNTIADAVKSGLQASFDALTALLNRIISGVKKASLLIPWNGN